MELIEERISYIERIEARGRLWESEKRLSQNIYERGVDDAGLGDIRSKGDKALFGGRSTKEMKDYVEEKDLQGESAITVEHIENNTSVRKMLGERGIKPENLPRSEDIKKLEHKVKRENKKLAEESGKLKRNSKK